MNCTSGERIVGEAFSYTEVIQRRNGEGMIEFKYHHFAALNEWMGLRTNHQWLLTPQKETPGHSEPPEGGHNTTQKAVIKKLKQILPKLLDLTINIQEAGRTGERETGHHWGAINKILTVGNSTGQTSQLLLHKAARSTKGRQGWGRRGWVGMDRLENT